jgi:hypothetical protein
MVGNLVATPQVVCVEHQARDLGLAPLDTDGCWAYTTDGYVFVGNVRLASRNADDSSELWVGDEETCF